MDIELNWSTANGGFGWSETVEGFDFWAAISRGDFTEFYKRYPQRTNNMKQTLTRIQLLNLYRQFECKDFRNVIVGLLHDNVLEEDEYSIEIQPILIDRLFTEGTKQQQEACQILGIIKTTPKLPKSWEEIGRIDGFQISLGFAGDSNTCYGVYTSNPKNRDCWPTDAYKEAAIALAQLLQLQKIWREGWVPITHTTYYVIKCSITGNLIIYNLSTTSAVIGFETRKLTEEFLNAPEIKKLLEIAKPLL